MIPVDFCLQEFAKNIFASLPPWSADTLETPVRHLVLDPDVDHGLGQALAHVLGVAERVVQVEGNPQGQAGEAVLDLEDSLREPLVLL